MVHFIIGNINTKFEPTWYCDSWFFFIWSKKGNIRKLLITISYLLNIYILTI